MCTTRLTIYATDGRASPATRGSPPSPTTRGSLPRDGRASPPPPLVVGFGLAAGHLGQSLGLLEAVFIVMTGEAQQQTFVSFFGGSFGPSWDSLGALLGPS